MLAAGPSRVGRVGTVQRRIESRYLGIVVIRVGPKQQVLLEGLAANNKKLTAVTGYMRSTYLAVTQQLRSDYAATVTSP